MKVIVVREVNYDGGQIGRCWRMCVCLDNAAAAGVVELFTKPVSYSEGERKFEPHVYREGLGITIIGFRGPSTFVYYNEQDVIEQL